MVATLSRLILSTLKLHCSHSNQSTLIKKYITHRIKLYSVAEAAEAAVMVYGFMDYDEHSM